METELDRKVSDVQAGLQRIERTAGATLPAALEAAVLGTLAEYMPSLKADGQAAAATASALGSQVEADTRARRKDQEKHAEENRLALETARGHAEALTTVQAKLAEAGEHLSGLVAAREEAARLLEEAQRKRLVEQTRLEDALRRRATAEVAAESAEQRRDALQAEVAALEAKKASLLVGTRR